MSISNKEVIQKLTQYFMNQDKSLVCRLLANAMIDYNRIYNSDILPDDELENLNFRIRQNSNELKKFIDNGCSCDEDLTIQDIGKYEK